MDWQQLFDQSTQFTLFVTATCLAICMAAEMFVPRREPSQSLAWRWGNNFSLAAITWTITRLASYGLGLAIAQWTVINQVGLFQSYPAGFWLPFITLIVVTQFIGYWTHRAFHEISWLWPVHAVHHSDVDVDISTSYRHHPLEPLVFMPVISPLIMLLGVGPNAVLAYYVFTAFLTVFSHTNMLVPAGWERWLRLLVVTPDFHRVHHSSERNFTNSNYGSVVPWFDYVFGTAKHRPFDEHRDFELGLEYQRERRDGRIDQILLKLPRPSD
ncbi:MAG: sterol desaturase family protein [Pseudomonadota bacterium]